ncbi:hypothetical protein L7F22_013151 [Adiantum nelumboides]|nr:hypothetical protein [Adiantum nelumboides]
MGNFNHGDRVCMFVATQKVAIGTVFEINPSAYCSGMLIGEGNVSVSVDLCFEKKAIIPFPTMDALTVGDAFHSIVKWSSGSLQHINEMQYKGASMHEADKAEGALDAQCNGMSYREVWKDKRVQLWDESKTHVVAEGVVMYVCPFDSVNFGELGEDNIGIGIETSYADEATILAEASVCSINLVCWPIKRVTTMDGKALLRYEDLHAMHELQDTCIESPYLVEPISKKQKYCFVNRKPKMSVKPYLVAACLVLHNICIQHGESFDMEWVREAEAKLIVRSGRAEEGQRAVATSLRELQATREVDIEDAMERAQGGNEGGASDLGLGSERRDSLARTMYREHARMNVLQVFGRTSLDDMGSPSNSD